MERYIRRGLALSRVSVPKCVDLDILSYTNKKDIRRRIIRTMAYTLLFTLLIFPLLALSAPLTVPPSSSLLPLYHQPGN